MAIARQSFAARSAAIFNEFWSLFFNFQHGDEISGQKQKIAEKVAIFSFYELTNWWGFILYSAIIGALTATGQDYLLIMLVGFLFDLAFASVYLAGSIRSGKDLTLGSDFRRGIDGVIRHGGVSRIVGYLVFLLTVVAANAWNGPEQLLMMFKPEIQTRWRKHLPGIVVGLVGLSALQTLSLGSVLWGVVEALLWAVSLVGSL